MPLQSIECRADVIVTASRGKKGKMLAWWLKPWYILGCRLYRYFFIIIRDQLYLIDLVVPVLITQVVIQGHL